MKKSRAAPKRCSTEGNNASKRRKTNSTTTTTTTTQQTPIVKPFAQTYFEELMTQAGLKLWERDPQQQVTPQHILTKGPLIFLDQLKSTLEKNVDYPRSVTEFVKGLDIWAEDEEHLNSLLTDNVSIQPSGDQTLGDNDPDPEESVSDSILRLLLRLECLHQPIAEMLLRRTAEPAIADRPEQVQLMLKPFIPQDGMTADSVLAKGLVDLLQMSERAVRLEIITWLSDIVSQSQHQFVALKLCSLMAEDCDLTPAVLSCLSCFSLAPDLKVQVRSEMLTALRSTVPMHFFPNIVNFFFADGVVDDEEIINGLRDGLDWVPTADSASAADVDTSQVVTSLSLKAALLKPKIRTEWVKIINRLKLSGDHKPLDFIVLLIIYSLGSNKNKIENLFRKKIKSSLFTCSLLTSTIKKLKPIVKEYLADCLELAKSLLKSKNDPFVKDFSTRWFVELFEELPDSQRTIVYELMHQDFVDESESVGNSLTVLTKIAAKNMDSLKPFSLQILAWKDNVNVFGAAETTQLMDLLCGLAFDVDDSNLQDSIHMLIRKELSSTDMAVKNKGIVISVMAIKHMTRVASTQISSSSESTYEDINNLPEGSAKEAALIVKFVLKSTSKFPEMICNFYDQFADMLNTCENIDEKFLKWLCNSFTADFQNSFIDDLNACNFNCINGIGLSQQFCLNAAEEIEDPIVINIGNIVIGENLNKVDLQVLPSWFRVLQLVYKKNNDEELSTIDALLGSGVVMPVIDDDRGLEEFNSASHGKILNCFVHAINWFRELVCAFSSPADEGIKVKVLKRLNDLILLEKKLTLYLDKISFDYKPPISVYSAVNDKPLSFVSKDNKIKKGGKKSKTTKKKNQAADVENIPPNDTLHSQINISFVNSQGAVTNTNCKLNTSLFRNIQFDVVNLLNLKLSMEENSSETVTPKMNLDSLLFILNEINPKLTQIFPSRVIKEGFFKSTKSKCINIDPISAWNKLLPLIPTLCENMEVIAENTQKLIDSHDGIRDAAGLFSEENAKAQMCLTSILEMFTCVFSWIGFQSNENVIKLKEGLKLIACRRDASNEKLSTLKDIIIETSIYILRYKDWCLLISTAAGLVKFFDVLTKLLNDRVISEKLINLSLDMLKQNWRNIYGDVEKGLHFNQHVNTLLSGYFSKPNIGMIKSLSVELCDQYPDLTKKNHVLSTFQCISKTNFPLLFRCLYYGLYEVAKITLEKGLTDKQHLELWKDVAIIMKFLTNISKMADNRSNLLALLKQSIPLLKLFLSQGMPMMDIKLKDDPDAVVEILKILQHSTRFLNSIYCHSRLKKDGTLIAYLPQMKLVLESLVYRVKASLVANDCSEVFWMGNLKNKNLQGDLIESQVSTQTTGSDDEDQLPEDDKDISDCDLDDDCDMKSVSSVY